MLGAFQPKLRKLRRRRRLVNTIAISHAALAVVLARADPYDQVVRGIDRHTADRVRAIAVEDRRQVVPELVVFQTPPEAATTYQVLCLSGSTVMSPTRPDIRPARSPAGSSGVDVFLACGTIPRWVAAPPGHQPGPPAMTRCQEERKPRDLRHADSPSDEHYCPRLSVSPTAGQHLTPETQVNKARKHR